MADGKEYVSRPDELGNIHISEEVLAVIAAAAAMEVEGVGGQASNPLHLHGSGSGDHRQNLLRNMDVPKLVRAGDISLSIRHSGHAPFLYSVVFIVPQNREITTGFSPRAPEPPIPRPR